MKNPKDKTSVLGYFGYQNAGDDAFFDFWKNSMGAPTSSLSRNLQGSNAENAILGGGAIVNDYFISRLPDSYDRLSLYGCSLPYGDGDVELLVPLADKISDIYLRSKRDTIAAKKLFPQAQYVPDLIFSHDFADRFISLEEILGYCEVPPVGIKVDRKNMILLLSDHYRATELDRHFTIESFKYKLAGALDFLSQFYNIICVPMSMWHDSRDNIFAADVVSKMKNRASVALIDKYLGASDIYNIIKSQAALVITMKYHGIVFSMKANVPFINIGDTRKNFDLLSDSGLEGLNSSLNNFDHDRFLEIVKYAETTGVLSTISEVSQENSISVASAMENVRFKLIFDE
ncbi:polysaccharide pyruvyl transferase family protein [Oxalobacteraceae sp. CFBP 8761]|nr:polysaccharide pyruvyl transferase family protein [Oxalobacteraceae sp. CFBP 8761]